MQIEESGHHDFVAVFLYVYIFIAADCPRGILLQVCADNPAFFAHFLKIVPPKRLVWALRGISWRGVAVLGGRLGEADSSAGDVGGSQRRT